jgi:predicted RNase H-like nuclease
MAFTVVGVDCATQEARTGLAYGVIDGEGRLELKRAALGTDGESAAHTVASWIAGTEQYVVALDAPLGWPAALADALPQHRAGEPIAAEPERLFRRETDRFVHKELRKPPLEVGADRIARTARAALELLQRIREAAREPLPLAWLPGTASGAIEVYPAATLLSRGISPRGYKGDSAAGRKAREVVLARLLPELRLMRDHDRNQIIDNDHMLDAVVCAVAAADFARGLALAPEDRALAEREGWIWFRGRGQGTLF